MTSAFTVLAPVGSWLLDHEWILQAAFWVLVACAIGVVLLIAYGLLHLARHMWHGIRWTVGRLRHQRDVRRMARQPLPPHSPSLEDLANYRTIRDAWRQPTRKEIKR
jgi:hypothetical protein